MTGNRKNCAATLVWTARFYYSCLDMRSIADHSLREGRKGDNEFEFERVVAERWEASCRIQAAGNVRDFRR